MAARSRRFKWPVSTRSRDCLNSIWPWFNSALTFLPDWPVMKAIGTYRIVRNVQRVRSYALQLAERPFASMSGIMVASFPLEDGAEFVYPGFGWGGMTNPAMSWRTVEVVGRERLSIPGRGEMLAWKVKTGNLWFWLSKEAPYFLRAEAVSANGGKTTFDVQSWEAGSR